MEPGQEPVVFEVDASSPAISPDGRWLAYGSPGSGLTSVFVRPVEGDGKWQVSPGPGGYPAWSGDGRKLYYIDIGSTSRPLMEVDIAEGETFRAGPPRVLIDDLAYRFTTSTAPITNWHASQADRRFVFVELDRDESARVRIDMILNWAQNLQ
jgi:Tol biopolymer transport system component